MARKPPTCGVALPRRPFPALPPPAPRKAPVRRPGARPAPAARAKAPEAVPVRPRAPLGLPAPATPRSALPPFPGARARGPLAHIVGTPRAERPQEPVAMPAPRRRWQHSGGRPGYGSPMAFAADAWSTARPGDVVTWTPTDPGVLAAGGVPITGALVSIDPRRPRVVKLRVHGGITVTRSEMQGRLDFAGASAPAVPMYAAPAAPMLLEAPAVQAYHVEQSQGVVLEPLPLPLPAAPTPRKKATRQPREKKSGPSEATLPEALPVEVPEAPIVPDPPKPEPIVASASSPVGAVLLPDAEDSTSRKVADAEGKWSPHQRAVFDAIEKGAGHLVIEAVAGSGKSTTILEAIRRIPRNVSVLLVAFNKSIQKELQSKLPRDATNVTVSTLTALGFSVLRRYWTRAQMLTGGKGGMVAPNVRDFIVDGYGMRSDMPLGGNYKDVQGIVKDVAQLVALCESYLAVTREAIQAVQRDYEILLGMDGTPGSWTYKGRRVFTGEDVVQWVYRSLRHRAKEPPANVGYGLDEVVENRKTAPMAVAYREITEGGSVPPLSFRDMNFVPAIYPNMVPEVLYDVVFVDETQDMDVGQLTLVQKCVAPGGRIVVVGDRKQAIYRFRGADSQAIPRLIRELKATVLPLSVSYRVPECVAREARTITPSFKAADGAPEGICSKITAERMTKMWAVGDLMITRLNAVLLPMAMLAMSQGITPWILGEGNKVQNEIKDIVGRVRRRMAQGDDSVKGFLVALDEWRDARKDEVRSAVEARVKRWENDPKNKGKKWRDIEGTIAEDPEMVLTNLIFNAFWNNDGTGITQRPGVQSVRDIQGIVDSLVASEKDVEAMTPEEYHHLVSTRLVLTSTHRIKGGEANRVFVLADTYRFAFGNWRKRAPGTEAAMQEEMNLWYVAVTRAKNIPNPEVLRATGDFAAALAAGKPGELYYVEGTQVVVGDVRGLKDDAPDRPAGKPTRPNGARRRLKAAAPVRKRRRR